MRYVIAFLILFFSTFSFNSSAQYSLIGSNEPAGGSEKYGPYYRSSINSNLNYSRYAYLYTAEELKIRPGSKLKTVEWLKSINFILNGPNEFRIWFKNVPDNQLGISNTWSNLLNGAHKVFEDNNRSFTALNNQFEEFVLTDTFTYSGGSLLILTDHKKSGTATGPNRFYFEPANNKSIGIVSSSVLSSTSILDTMYGNFRPTIQIKYDDPLLSQFTVQSYMGGFSQPVGFVNDQAGNKYVWEKAGKVWIINTSDIKLPNPLLDISEEVGNWGDHGLVGFALDPAFSSNGYIYVCYTVDRHHLLYYGTPTYNATSNEYWQATIGRVVRYQADIATGFTTLVPGSRTILIGESISTGIPITYITHGLNSLLFGSDGSLLVSTGDGSSYQEPDTGNSTNAYYITALSDTILKPIEHIGAFRSQLVNNLNGKILRINPSNGDGLSSNPFYDSSNPRSASSRVFALGLRNPYKMSLKPNTGSSNILDGDPGQIFVGDVGWSSWEELNVVEHKGQNFGWPIFEGLSIDSIYSKSLTQNLTAPNPLFGTSGCTQPYFSFIELLKDDSLANPVYLNTCNLTDPIPASTPVFMHSRPIIDWRHYSLPMSRIPSFSLQGSPLTVPLADPTCPVYGMMFTGNASVPGLWYTNNSFPYEFRNTYFVADYIGGWIRNLEFDQQNNLFRINHFADSLGLIVSLGESTNDGCLYFIKYPSEIKRICFTGSFNDPPIANISVNNQYGASPLSVNFDASASFDPDGTIVSYLWDFGSGNSSSTSNPSFVFNGVAGVPSVQKVYLQVTDNLGKTGLDSITIHLNNTPPQATIISFTNGMLYSITQGTNLPLQAQVFDAEHGPSELFYEWRKDLYRMQHVILGPIDTNKLTSVFLAPVGCGNIPNNYGINLRVKDILGLETSVNSYLFPNCLGLSVQEGMLIDESSVYPNPSTTNTLNILSDIPVQSFELFDISGKRLESGNFAIQIGVPYQYSVNLEYINNSGIFFLKLMYKNGRSQTHKIVYLNSKN